MDKFRMMFQFLQSNQESFVNGICGIMAVASAQMYQTFEFSCPCMPEYNYTYSIGMLIVPPIWFFMLGFVFNNNISMLMEEWKRPTGGRRKDPTILRYMFCSMTQRSLIAPAVWVTVTLMHGKSFICAFSTNLEIERFGNFSVFKGISEEEHNCTQLNTAMLLCCFLQICGWLFLLMITFSAFLIRAIRPCFSQAAFLKTKYWSHYIDTERKMFDETCREHAKSFAKVCIHQYLKALVSDEEKLLGIRAQDDMNKVLWNWHTSKPALALRKEKMDTQSNGHLNGYKKAWAVYYSKV
uniref:Calcium homeostasis modulator 1 n=1 Tax=Neogobius melanostomus TaxID=47308 RepID=A0A8C6ULL1_9GOBI